MARYDTDRHLYLPIWRMLRHLLIVWSMTQPNAPGEAPADR